MGVLIVPGILLLLGAPIWMPALRWWSTARELGLDFAFSRTMAMRLRQVAPARVYLPLRRARDGGVEISAHLTEAHLLAGGNLDRVVDAMVLAASRNVRLDFDHATALDLAGRDPLEIVRSGPRTPDGQIDYAALFPKLG
ncbi:MAG: flotillin-like FloA family protein [Gemmatimonadetes bacterium]|nr:flotillin-like FloA family protein [Gemmatimonadota bacterium]